MTNDGQVIADMIMAITEHAANRAYDLGTKVTLDVSANVQGGYLDAVTASAVIQTSKESAIHNILVEVRDIMVSSLNSTQDEDGPKDGQDDARTGSDAPSGSQG